MACIVDRVRRAGARLTASIHSFVDDCTGRNPSWANGGRRISSWPSWSTKEERRDEVQPRPV